MAESTIKKKLNALNKATESFRTTKKKYISRICSAGAKHKCLKYPSLIAAVLFIFFVNFAFYLSLWVILNKRKAIGVLIGAIAVIGLTFIATDYFGTDAFYKETEDTFAVYKNEIDVIAFSDEAAEENADISDQNGDVAIEWQDLADIDFDGLHEINKDIVGWIYFENEEISYPILQGRTDDDYISTTYAGKSSREGSIFLESMNKPDFSDFHSIIYGHNMRNLSMFGRLRYYYRESDYYNDHKYFQVITPEKKYRYEIISYKHVPDDAPLYMVTGISGPKRNDFVQNTLMSGSMLGVSVQASENDHFVTLSTCSSGDDRFVVSAIRVDEISVFE